MGKEREAPRADETEELTIYPFMVNELGLFGRELIAYAVVYAFEHDGNVSPDGWFVRCGGMTPTQTVRSWARCSTQTASHCLGKLVDRGLLERRRTSVGGVTRAEYRTV